MDEVGSSPAPPAERKAILKPFLGPHGLRAGWRFLLFYLALFFSGFLLSGIGRFLMHRAGYKMPHTMSVGMGLYQESLLLGSLLCGLAVMYRYIERRPFRMDYLPRASILGKNFWVGSLWGISMLSAQLLAMRGLHLFYIDGFALDLRRGLMYGALWAVMFVMVGLFEESFSRGYPQRTLAQGTNFWMAAAVNSLLFGALHMGNGGENWVGIVSVVSVALFLCLTLWRTGNLWFAVGVHFAWDWGQTFLYGTPDSGMVAPGHLLNSHTQGPALLTGAADGPEGSFLVLIVLTLSALLFAVLYPERKWAPDAESADPRAGSLPILA